MKKLISHQDNCFDIIRIVAALLVLYSHHYALSGFEEPKFLQLESYGELAVTIFFSVSGYLIALSGMRSESFISYMDKRIKRIFPALIGCAVVIYIVIGSVINAGNIQDYYSHKLLVAILNLISLKGAPALNLSNGFIYPNAINGSLWTLPLEFSCYIFLAVGLCFSKSYKSILFLLITMLCFSIYFTYSPNKTIFYSIPVQHLCLKGISFFMGGLLALTKDKWNIKRTKIFMFVTSLLLLYIWKGSFEFSILAYILIPIIVIIIAVSFKDKIVHGKFDYSYGIYIYAFPTQQLIINKLKTGFFTSMFLSTIITVILSILSWHFVEKRFLSRK
ncbi:acyltransferase family protein [Rouxiella sp. Mn2063]|uniref:acyltransferase family protein n=1 Tax=Rouxiella sp. Mn2063 TaxID=3395262 RepID=UPI003BE9901E